MYTPSVQGLGFKIEGFELRVYDLRFEAYGLRFRVALCVTIRVWGFGFRVVLLGEDVHTWCSGTRIEDFRVMVDGLGSCLVSR